MIPTSTTGTLTGGCYTQDKTTLNSFKVHSKESAHRTLPTGHAWVTEHISGEFAFPVLTGAGFRPLELRPLLIQVVPHTLEEVTPQIPRSSFSLIAVLKARWELKPSI